MLQGGRRTNCGDGGDDLSKLELVKDGGLTGGIETHLLDKHSEEADVKSLVRRWTITARAKPPVDRAAICKHDIRGRQYFSY